MWLLLTSSAFAGDKIEAPTFVLLGVEMSVPVPSGAADVRAKLFVDHPLSRRFGVAAATIVSPAYAELYAGPVMYIDEVTIGVSLGLETADMPLRGAASLQWFRPRFAAQAFVEYGGSGLWYKGLARAAFGPVRLGAIAQRFDGVGPWVGLSSHEVSVWGAPVYDYEDASTSILAGCNWIL